MTQTQKHKQTKNNVPEVFIYKSIRIATKGGAFKINNPNLTYTCSFFLVRLSRVGFHDYVPRKLADKVHGALEQGLLTYMYS